MRWWVSVVFVAVYTTRAGATITVLDDYRLGDQDSGASSGNLANATTVDSAGVNNLSRVGSPKYSSTIPKQIVAGAINTLSIQNVTKGGFQTTAALISQQNNFGLEAFVNPSSLVADAFIAYADKPASLGFGLGRSGGNYFAELGGVSATTFGSAPATIGSWTHLAIVNTGAVTTFYVNGTVAGTTNAPTKLFGGEFYIGNLGNGSSAFVGFIDEVRLFTFEPGAFQTSDLLVPEPPGAVLLATGLLLATAFIRIRTRAPR